MGEQQCPSAAAGLMATWWCRRVAGKGAGVALTSGVWCRSSPIACISGRRCGVPPAISQHGTRHQPRFPQPHADRSGARLGFDWAFSVCPLPQRSSTWKVHLMPSPKGRGHESSWCADRAILPLSRASGRGATEIKAQVRSVGGEGPRPTPRECPRSRAISAGGLLSDAPKMAFQMLSLVTRWLGSRTTRRPSDLRYLVRPMS